jgi:DNA-binding transcriptional MerR regulator
MDKAPDAYRTISEVGEDLDIAQHVLRFWETRFPQIKPLKRGGGRRYYRPDDVELLKGIRHLLYKEGYTIKGVQRILREQGAKDVIAIGRAGGLVGNAAQFHLATPDEADDHLPAPVADESVMRAAPLPLLEVPPVQVPSPVAAAVSAEIIPVTMNVAAAARADAMIAPRAYATGGQVSFLRGGVARAESVPDIATAPDRRARLRSILAELEACRALIFAWRQRQS